MSYRVTLRLNIRPDQASAVIDKIAPALREVGLKFRNGAPGVIEGEGLSLADLGVALRHLSELPYEVGASDWFEKSGLIDDLWLHVSAERAPK
jgi:hypothetical protein